MLGVGGAEVHVPVEVVGQEAQAHLQGHQPGAVGQGLQLQGRQGAARGGEEPVGVGLEQPQVKVDLGEVGLVLGGGGGPGPDGIPKVKGAQAGHHGVQVDDADGLARGVVDEDVAHLGVVVGHPQGKLALPQQIHQQGAVLFALGGKVHLRPHLRKPARLVVLGGLQQLAVALGGVVEVLDSLVEGGGGVAGQQALELPKGPAGLPQHGGALHRLVGGGLVYKGHAAPGAALLIHKEGAALGGAADVQSLPQGVAAPGEDFLPQKLRHAGDVLHDVLGGGEHVAVDALDDVLAAVLHQKGVVDVAAVQAGGGAVPGQAEGL